MKGKMPADIVISNPPFGRYYNYGGTDNQHHRLGDISLEHFVSIIDCLKSGGQAAILLPDGVFYRSARSRKVLRNAIAVCNLNLVIQLPKTKFKGTNLTEVSLFVLSKKTKEELNQGNQNEIAIYDSREELNEGDIYSLLKGGLFASLKRLCEKRDYTEVNMLLRDKANRFKLCSLDKVIYGDALNHASEILTGIYSAEPELTELFDNTELRVPEGWYVSKLKNTVFRIIPGKSYKHEKRQPNFDEFGLFKTSAVSKCVLDITQSKTIVDASEIRHEHYVKAGDLLVCRANSPEYVGASVLVTEIHQRRVLSDKIWKLEVNDNYRIWVYLYLSSSYGRELMRSIATGSFESMKNMRQNDFLELAIPLPKCKVDVFNLEKACDLVLRKNIDRTDINKILSEITTSLSELSAVQ